MCRTRTSIELTVDELRRMVNNSLDLLLFLQMANSDTSQTAVDLETLDQDALADEFEGGDFFQNAVIGSLVEADRVYGLVLDLSL